MKFYLTAEPKERAKRRLAELREAGGEENPEQIQKALEERDRQDETREIGPLAPADDAIVIDTTDLSIEEVVGELLCRVEEECLRKD